MANWIRIASAADCPPGTGVELVVEDRVIVLFNVDGEFHAIDGVCSHQGGPLGKGRLEGCTVTCPWHGWQYNVASGRHLLSQITQRVFPVKRAGDDVLVDLGEDA